MLILTRKSMDRFYVLYMKWMIVDQLINSTKDHKQQWILLKFMSSAWTSFWFACWVPIKGCTQIYTEHVQLRPTVWSLSQGNLSSHLAGVVKLITLLGFVFRRVSYMYLFNSTRGLRKYVCVVRNAYVWWDYVVKMNERANGK